MSLSIVPLLSFGAFLTVLGLRATDPLLPMIAHTFGILPGAASITITGFGIGYGLLQVVHGPLGDRFGKFRMMAFLSAASAISAWLCSVAPTLGTLVAARIAHGAMTGGLIPLSMAWIGDAVPYDRRQAVIARFMLGNFTGIALGPSLCSLLAEASDWRLPFQVMAVLHLVACVLLWRADKRRRLQPDASGTPGSPAHRQTISESFFSMIALLRNAWVRIVLLAVAISGSAVFAPLAFVPLHAQTHLGAGIAQSSWLMIAFALGSAAYSLASAQFVRRMGEYGMLITGGALLMAAWIAIATSPSMALAFTAALVIGLGTMLFHNTLQVHATQMAPESRGAAMALFAAMLFGSQSLAIAVGGYVADRFGTAPIFLFCAVAGPLGSLIFLRALRRHAAAG